MSKPVEVEFLMKDKLTPGMNKAEREALELRNTVRLLEAELERLRLAGETAAPNLDQSANIAQIHALEKQLEELRGKLKLLQEESESVQVTPADMPNAQRQFNGLHNSIQQMAREMPSLAMGPQMFFLAISNNLPIFTDELARARKEYDELQKSGKKGTPVWKQVLSSLFSWQTAMTTGIMLLVMYGDEIWDWTKNLFSAKKGVDEFNISLKEMTEIEKDGRAQMVRTRFELKSVIDEIKNFTGSSSHSPIALRCSGVGSCEPPMYWYSLRTGMPVPSAMGFAKSGKSIFTESRSLAFAITAKLAVARPWSRSTRLATALSRVTAETSGSENV